MTGPDDRPATPAVEIAAHRESRWRCGVEHKARARLWPAGSWTAEQLEQLKADPRLTVIEYRPGDAPPGEAVDPEDFTMGVDDLVRQADQLTDVDLAVLMGLIGTMAYDRQISMETFDEARAQLEARTGDPTLSTSEAKDPGGGASQEAPAGDPEKKDPPMSTRHERLVAGCKQVPLGDPKNWTKSGKPQVDALYRASNVTDITAAERDAAWKVAQGQA